MAEGHGRDDAGGQADLLGPLEDVLHRLLVRPDADGAVVGLHAGGHGRGGGRESVAPLFT